MANSKPRCGLSFEGDDEEDESIFRVYFVNRGDKKLAFVRQTPNGVVAGDTDVSFQALATSFIEAADSLAKKLGASLKPNW